jgi:hypothetical protein
MIDELVKLADKLDRQGSRECADTLDAIIERYAEDLANIERRKSNKEENKKIKSGS